MAGAGVAVRAGFGVGGFLAAATVGDAGAVSDVGAPGRGDAAAGLAVEGAVWREADAVEGSGVMMLTGGVEDALGNSALVGLPVGTPGMRAATGATAGAAGAFQSTEYRPTIPS